MRRAGILAGRYARALFLIGQERKILDSLQSDMFHFAEMLNKNQDFNNFFVSPEVTRIAKEQKIKELFENIFSPVFFNFLFVVLKKGRQNLFVDISEAFSSELDVFYNRIKASVVSSVELTPEMVKEIREQLSKQLKKEVILITESDEALIGGIRITVDGKVIDGSVKGQLDRMKKYLAEQSVENLN